jgi:hypothetical protein
VQRHGGTVSLKLLGDAIARVQVGTDRTAAELAVRRLREDFAVLEDERNRFENAALLADAKVPGCGTICCLFVMGLVLTAVLAGCVIPYCKLIGAIGVIATVAFCVLLATIYASRRESIWRELPENCIESENSRQRSSPRSRSTWNFSTVVAPDRRWGG